MPAFGFVPVRARGREVVLEWPDAHREKYALWPGYYSIGPNKPIVGVMAGQKGHRGGQQPGSREQESKGGNR